jgi:hypothetical protein
VTSDEVDVQQAVLEWRRRTVAEYASAAKAARLSHLLIALGADRGLINLALRVTRDELDHAELSAKVAEALGDEEAPVGVDLELLLGPEDRRPVAAAATLLLEDFCIGETLAVPLFEAMRAGATEPAAVEALRRICRDEAVHRAFAWRALDALLEVDPPGVHGLIDGLLPAALGRFAATYGEVSLALQPGPRGLGAGLLPGTTWRAIFWRTLETEVLPRFAARGWAPSPPTLPAVVG